MNKFFLKCAGAGAAAFTLLLCYLAFFADAEPLDHSDLTPKYETLDNTSNGFLQLAAVGKALVDSQEHTD